MATAPPRLPPPVDGLSTVIGIAHTGGRNLGRPPACGVFRLRPADGSRAEVRARTASTDVQPRGGAVAPATQAWIGTAGRLPSVIATPERLVRSR